MNTKAKLASLGVTAALIAGMTACGVSTTPPVVIEGTEFLAGEFIFAQLGVMPDAYAQFEEENPDQDTTQETFDYLNYTLEGISFADWVNQKAVEKLKLCKVYELKAAELGVVVSEDEKKTLRQQITSVWTEDDPYIAYYGIDEKSWGEYYEKLGIGKQSYQNAFLYDVIKEKVFHKYYGEDGLTPVPDEDLFAEVEKTNARARVLQVSKTDVNNEGLTTTEAAALKTRVDNYVTDLKNGRSFAEIDLDYEAFLDAEDRRLNPEDYENQDESAEETETELKEDNDYDEQIGIDSTKYGEEVTKKLFEMAVGDVEVIEDDNNYYVISRLNLREREDWLENEYETVLHSLRDEEFDEMMAAEAVKLTAELNQSEINKYKIKKLF